MPYIAGVGERGTGWKASAKALALLRSIREVEESLGAGRRTTALPAFFSWRPYAPLVEDQGQTPACTGAGTSVLTATVMKKMGVLLNGDPNAVPSPGLTFRGAKALERAALLGPGQAVSIPLPSLDDGTGCGTADAVAFMADEGVAPMRGPTPDGRNFDLWTAADTQGMTNPPAPNVGVELAGPDLIVSRTQLIVGEAALDTAMAAADFVAALKTTLLLAPVAWGGTVDSQVFNYVAGGTPFGPANLSDPNRGGHLTAIMGWRPSVLGDGTDDWEIMQSWGPNFGDSGWCYGRQDWAQSASELIAWTLKLKGPNASNKRP